MLWYIWWSLLVVAPSNRNVNYSHYNISRGENINYIPSFFDLNYVAPNKEMGGNIANDQLMADVILYSNHYRW